MKRVLISGATKGIGKAIAKAFDDPEYELIACARGREGLEALSAEIKNTKAAGLQLDLSTNEGVASLKTYLEENGFPHIVVANLNIARGYKKLEYYEDASQFFTGIDDHLRYLLEIMPGTLKHQREQHFGRWIGISSAVSAMQGIEGMASYVVQKRMLEGLFDTLALEVADSGITVNTIQPGLIATERIFEDQRHHKLSKANIQQRPGTPEEVAGLVKYLSSENAGYVTGDKIKIDGGASKTWFLGKMKKEDDNIN